jgi:hypothetical protein
MQFSRSRSYRKRGLAMKRAQGVTTFPYIPTFSYRVSENEITIVAVAHAKRKPGYWKTRE